MQVKNLLKMSEQSQENNQQRDVAEMNWDSFSNEALFNDDVKVEETKQEEPKEEQNNNTGDENAQDKSGSEENTQEGSEETAEGEETVGENTDKQDDKTNETTEENKEETPVVEFKSEDVEGFEKEPEDGTWLAVAKAKGLTITEDSYEAYDKALEEKIKSIETAAKSITIENIYSELKPETVAVLKLIESGIPEEQVFAPTQMIDGFLALEDAALLREDLKASGMTDEQIDIELEMQTEKGWLKHSADKLRMALNAQKEQIVKQREEILQQYSQNKEKVALEQKQQEAVRFQSALDTVSKFMNIPLSAEAKDAIRTKYNRGEYDQSVKDPKSMVELILWKEFGEKAIKHVENTAYQRGRDEKTKKLHSVPPVSGKTANRQAENNQIGNFDLLEQDFGK
jgi:hypothetical protein